MLAAAMLFFSAHVLPAAQTPAAQKPAKSHPAVSAHKAVHRRSHPATAHPKAPQVLDVVAPVAPPAPKLPLWPVNERPEDASVTWDSHGLRIDAHNSSLQQILSDVSTATGVKVEGMGADVRVFGVYGPGQARDVLSQLLHGCGYNVIMIGDQGQGAPRQIILSARSAGSAPNASFANAASNNDDEAVDNESDEQPQQQSPAPVIRPNFVPGGPPRTPQQIMEEMRERQGQIQTQNPPPD